MNVGIEHASGVFAARKATKKWYKESCVNQKFACRTKQEQKQAYNLHYIRQTRYQLQKRNKGGRTTIKDQDQKYLAATHALKMRHTFDQNSIEIINQANNRTAREFLELWHSNSTHSNEPSTEQQNQIQFTTQSGVKSKLFTTDWPGGSIRTELTPCPTSNNGFFIKSPTHHSHKIQTYPDYKYSKAILTSGFLHEWSFGESHNKVNFDLDAAVVAGVKMIVTHIFSVSLYSNGH